MLSECLNPECRKELHYLRDGKVVRVVRQEEERIRVEHFWLCGPCSIQFQVERDKEADIRLVPRRPVRMRVVPDSVLEPKTPTALAS